MMTHRIQTVASLFLLILVLVSVKSDSREHIHYVLPSDTSNETCPNEACFTLDQFTENIEAYFITGSTFVFLVGNHSLQNEVSLINVSDITFRSDTENVTIACKNGITISCNNVRNFRIEGLIFLSDPHHFNKSSSALKVVDSIEILISDSLFQGSGDLNESLTRAIYSINSTIKIIQCVFEGNVGENGGVINAESSILNLTDNLFHRNLAKLNGGAIYALQSSVTIEGTWFHQNFATLEGGALYSNASIINITSFHEFGIVYSFNFAIRGGAIFLRNSAATMSGTNTIAFQFNTAKIGGGIFIIENSRVFLSSKHLNFTGNTAVAWGGAIHCKNAYLTLGEIKNGNFNNYFSDNRASKGAAIYFTSSRLPKTLTIMGRSCFVNNTVSGPNAAGGAVHVYFSHFFLSSSIKFLNNEASYYGGGLYVVGSNILINGVLIFTGNSAEFGGGMYIESSRVRLITASGQLNFFDNVAWNQGGGLHISNLVENNDVVISTNFLNNTAMQCGGAIYIENTGRNVVYLMGINIENSVASALCVSDSSIAFVGDTALTDNRGKRGGGIYSRSSSLLFTGNTLFSNNTAFIGGAIFSLFETTLTFNGTARFTHNTADTDGGAIYAVGTDINFMFNTMATFGFNSAQNGGAMYLRSTATLKTEPHVNFTTFHNHAFEYGGAVYFKDTAIPTQCDFEMSTHENEKLELPYCFLKLEGIVSTPNRYYLTTQINSYYDSALDGSFLYGGLLDRCQMQVIKSSNARKQNSFLPYKAFQNGNLLHIIEMRNNTSKPITSRPYQLCFCESSKIYDCSGLKNVKINRGQRFNVSLLALDQLRNSTSTVVTAKTSETATLKFKQNSQPLFGECSTLSYNLYSTQEHEKITLYPNGPCRDTGVAEVIVNATLFPCPDAFVQSGQQCVCEDRLQFYEADCLIDDDIYISKKSNSKFWMGALNDNGSYEGLILYRTCPTDYCKSNAINITLDNLDIQCNANRGRLLCGSCKHSLLFGGFKCEACPNAYLGLFFIFAAAGIVLVIFLSFLRLTVATGMINSLILYANIIQVNKTIFFTTNTTNILTVFIAWLNLDLGFEVCFYNGMDAYVQTWLQFAFPLYVWVIISVIIFTSRYSITMTKLIGHNPIAVLATLLLMSYTKILKIIIEVYSYVYLDYPDNKIVTVWLKDANVPYLESKHLILTVVTSLILILFFVPYTLLLLLGFRLYKYFGWKHLRKIKPLLDSYYAPYKMHTRYWTGFLLLVRCVLYIVFSFNSLGGTKKSLLAINITFTAIVVIAWLSARIYKKTATNIIEASIYLNLVALSALALAEANSAPLVYSLVGVAFVLMIIICLYHFHICYTVKIWLKIRTKITALMTRKGAEHDKTILDGSAAKSSHDPHKLITETVIDIREPLLEN